MKANYFHIVGIALLLSFLALIIGLVPFMMPIKNQIVTTFNTVKYAGNVKNFGSSDLETTDSKTIKSFENCPINLKIKTAALEEVLQPNQQTDKNLIIVKKKGDDTALTSALQITCLTVDGQVTGFRDSVITKGETDEDTAKLLGMSNDELKKLSVRDFYKLYTEKISTKCAKSSDYKTFSFLNNNLEEVMDKEYNVCKNESTDAALVTADFYFFPKEAKNTILFVKTNNLESFKNDFLITKR